MDKKIVIVITNPANEDYFQPGKLQDELVDDVINHLLEFDPEFSEDQIDIDFLEVETDDDN